MQEPSDKHPPPVTGPTRTYAAVSAILAVVLWGGWAWIANAEAAKRLGVSPAASAIAQGIFSGCMTLVMVRSNTWLFGRLQRKPLAMLLPAIIIVSIAACLLTLIHTLVGTPNVLRTVTPALVVALCFNLFTTFKISRSTTGSQPY